MHSSKRGVVTLAAVALATLLPAWATGAYGAGSAGDDRVLLLTGGIGVEEADVMRAMAPQYPLQLTFVRKGDDREEFVADVRLTIVDGAGRVVVQRTSGPLVLLRLPDGVYTLSAEYAGQQKTRRVAVDNSRHEKVALVWS